MLDIRGLTKHRAELEAQVRALRRDLHVLLGCKMMAEMPEGYQVFFRGWLEQAEDNYQLEQRRIRSIGLQAYYMELYEKQRRCLESADNDRNRRIQSLEQKQVNLQKR